jgi:small subunit ribosomal protein S6
LAQIYEGMFLLDNEVVRAGWREAKAVVTDILTKNGAEVRTARRWDERRLAYPVRRRRRATYLLAYYTIPPEGIHGLVRDLDLNETVLRYLQLRADLVPETEAELAAAEDAADFVAPVPPADDATSDEGAERSDSDAEEEDLDSDDEMRPARRGKRAEPVGAGAARGDDGDGDEVED